MQANTGRLWIGVCAGISVLAGGCSPWKQFTESKGYAYVPRVGTESVLAMTPASNFSQTGAVIGGDLDIGKSSGFTRKVSIPLSFVFAPQDVKSQAETENLTLGFAPTYGITVSSPKTVTATAVAPDRLLQPSEKVEVAYSELHTGPVTEEWGGTVTVKTGAAGGAETPGFSPGVDITTKFEDRLVGYRTRVLTPAGTKSINLAKGSSSSVEEVGAMVKFGSVFLRGGETLANIHIIPQIQSGGLVKQWSDHPGDVQRVRFNGGADSLAEGGFVWNRNKGLRPLAQTEVVLPMRPASGADDIAVLYVAPSECLLVKLDQFQNGGDEASITLQRIVVK